MSQSVCCPHCGVTSTMDVHARGCRALSEYVRIRRRRDFRFPGGHGRTWIQRLGSTRRVRHISVWFGQTPEDVNRYIKPRFTLSIDLYREPRA
jgi:hypothetical protein